MKADWRKHSIVLRRKLFCFTLSLISGIYFFLSLICQEPPNTSPILWIIHLQNAFACFSVGWQEKINVELILGSGSWISLSLCVRLMYIRVTWDESLVY